MEEKEKIVIGNFLNLSSEDRLGPEYVLALERALHIRENRRKIYGDSFKNETIDSLFSIAQGKINRFKVLLESDTYEARVKGEDEILDIINYLVFMLAKLNGVTDE